MTDAKLDQSLRALASDVANRVALGQFDEVCQQASIPDCLSADDLRRMFQLWDLTPRLRQSDEAERISVRESVVTERRTWWVAVGMWTVEEGESALTLNLMIEEHEDGLRWGVYSLLY